MTKFLQIRNLRKFIKNYCLKLKTNVYIKKVGG